MLQSPDRRVSEGSKLAHPKGFAKASNPIGGVLHDKSASPTYTIETNEKDRIVIRSVSGKEAGVLATTSESWPNPHIHCSQKRCERLPIKKAFARGAYLCCSRESKEKRARTVESGEWMANKVWSS